MSSYAETTVTLPHGGSIRGKVLVKGVRGFLDIPYATVVRRWRPARKAQAWQGERNGTKFGPKCPQAQNTHTGGLFDGGKHVKADETDCLNLNVFIPEKASSDGPLPVMVWIHGGAFKDGTASMELYTPDYAIDHATHISHPVIVVTVNYRLNVFGFFGSKEIAADVNADRTLSEDEKSVGNWGLLDQKLAFEWVKENIEAFGGDPDNITAYGESTGAIAIAYHMIIPTHRGLFRRAILESGSVQTKASFTFDAQQKAFDDFLAYFEIPSYIPDLEKVQQLRAIPADKFGEAVNKIKPDFGPHLDGVLLTEDSRKTARNADSWDAGVKEVMLGDCKDEGKLFVDGYGWNTVAWYNGYVAALPDDFKLKFDKHYPAPSTDEEALVIGIEIFGDGTFGYPINKAAKIFSNGAKRKVYYYHFDHDVKESADWKTGIHHGSEVPFVFLRKPHLHGDEVHLAEKMVEFWVRFAYGEELEKVGWPEYAESGKALEFRQDGEAVKEDGPRKELIYRFWDDLEEAVLA